MCQHSTHTSVILKKKLEMQKLKNFILSKIPGTFDVISNVSCAIHNGTL